MSREDKKTLVQFLCYVKPEHQFNITCPQDFQISRVTAPRDRDWILRVYEGVLTRPVPRPLLELVFDASDFGLARPIGLIASPNSVLKHWSHESAQPRSHARFLSAWEEAMSGGYVLDGCVRFVILLTRMRLT